MKKIIIFILYFTLTSCSLFQGNQETVTLKGHKRVQNQDILDYYSNIGEVYKSFKAESIWKVSGKEKKFLKSIYKKLKSNNELLLNKDKEPEFFIVFSSRPIYFALPNGQYFFSSGLFNKYLKNEDLLLAVMARESIRWNTGLYPKKIRVPIGYISGQEILDEIRLPLRIRVELNKWAYNAIKRSGVDASVYLNWLQLQNKNVLDFSMLTGDVNLMAKEEFLFKDFLISIDVFEDKFINQRSSSEGFYKLKNKIRRMYEIRKV